MHVNRISIVIRTLNEEKFLDELLCSIENQDTPEFEIETILVDSGSTDRTLRIAENHCATIVCIKQDEFSFGRSLNLGCDVATGQILVFVSGHCVAKKQQVVNGTCNSNPTGNSRLLLWKASRTRYNEV